MDRGVALAAAMTIGGAVAMQAPLNATLGRTVGGVTASAVALGVSFCALTLLAAVTGGLSGLGRLGDVPLGVAVGGGLIGGLYVGSIVFTVRALGAGGLTAATIAGQLAIAVAIDHFGWLGVARSPVTLSKVVGVLLLAVGTLLVVRGE
jgi:transporter family-2 protein